MCEVQELKEICGDNIEYFDVNSYENLVTLHREIFEVLFKLESHVKKIEKFAPEYDFDENTPENGYRSFVRVFYKAVQFCVIKVKTLQANRGGWFFRRKIAEK